MVKETQVFSGILRIEGKNCKLVQTDRQGHTHSFPLFFNLPTGASFSEGFSAATRYLQDALKKNDGDRISVHGIKSSYGRSTSIVQLIPPGLQIDHPTPTTKIP